MLVVFAKCCVWLIAHVARVFRTRLQHGSLRSESNMSGVDVTITAVHPSPLRDSTTGDEFDGQEWRLLSQPSYCLLFSLSPPSSLLLVVCQPSYRLLLPPSPGSSSTTTRTTTTSLRKGGLKVVAKDREVLEEIFCQSLSVPACRSDALQVKTWSS